MQKTLGQILYEANPMYSERTWDWKFADHEAWEAAAQAVREAVIDECMTVVRNSERGCELEDLQDLRNADLR